MVGAVRVFRWWCVVMNSVAGRVAGRWEMKEWTGANAVLIAEADEMEQALDWRGVAWRKQRGSAASFYL